MELQMHEADFPRDGLLLLVNLQGKQPVAALAYRAEHQPSFPVAFEVLSLGQSHDVVSFEAVSFVPCPVVLEDAVIRLVVE